MALIPCPECHREVSTAATACPHCGRPMTPASYVTTPPAPSASVGPEATLWRGSPSGKLLLGKMIILVVAVIGLPLLLTYILRLFDSYALVQDHRSGVVMAGWIAIAVIILIRVFDFALALARIRTTIYTVTNQRVIIESGLTTKSVEDIDLRYIDDSSFQQSFIERMLGIGNVTIVSSDKVAPAIILHGINDPRSVRELIRANAYQVSQRQLFTRAT